MSDRKQSFLQRLENEGEDKVRENIKLGRYGSDHLGWAELWISSRDQERLAAQIASQEELARLQAIAARDAADASRLQAEASEEANRIAREANQTAHKANMIAMLALIAAIIAIAATILDVFVD